MIRHPVTFACAGTGLVGTLDPAPGSTGLLLVSGGNEPRSGAWAGQAQLAARIAREGHPVFRFDPPGVGDSDGVNHGFRHRSTAIAAALTAFRDSCPQVTRIAALGNCDAASTLMLSRGAGLDALILSNPWTIEQDDAPPPPAALRTHYRRRLADPVALMRLLSGRVSAAQLVRSLRDALRPPSPPPGLAQEMAAGIADFAGPIRILVAERDRTAQTFLAAWRKADPRIHRCAGASHSYVEAEARDWLAGQVIDALRELARA